MLTAIKNGTTVNVGRDNRFFNASDECTLTVFKGITRLSKREARKLGKILLAFAEKE